MPATSPTVQKIVCTGRCEKSESHSVVRLSVTPFVTAAHQAPLSVGFSRQEYWSGLPCPSPGGFPDPRVEPGSLALQADSLLAGLRGEPEGCSWCAVLRSDGLAVPLCRWSTFYYPLASDGIWAVSTLGDVTDMLL